MGHSAHHIGSTELAAVALPEPIEETVAGTVTTYKLTQTPPL